MEKNSSYITIYHNHDISRYSNFSASCTGGDNSGGDGDGGGGGCGSDDEGNDGGGCDDGCGVNMVM